MEEMGNKQFGETACHGKKWANLGNMPLLRPPRLLTYL